MPLASGPVFNLEAHVGHAVLLDLYDVVLLNIWTQKKREDKV